MPDGYNGREQFFRNIQNGIARFEQNGRPFMTAFLTPSEKILVEQQTKKTGGRFDGARRDAIRCRYVLGLPEDKEVCATLKAELPAGSRQLKHSDVLGALIHSGMKRESIGDIACTPSCVYLVCLKDLEEFVMQEIVHIARQNVSFEPCDPDEMPAPEFEHLKINTASLRADCIVGALAHCSRSEAKEQIAQGFVKVNDLILESVKPLCNNDVISVRRVGKFLIQDIDGVSRKGRLIVNILKYQ